MLQIAVQAYPEFDEFSDVQSNVDDNQLPWRALAVVLCDYILGSWPLDRRDRNQQSPSSKMAGETNMAPSLDSVDLIPGTEIISDDGSAKIQLIPKPSSDPRDPLNWSRKWKRMFLRL